MHRKGNIFITRIWWSGVSEQANRCQMLLIRSSQNRNAKTNKTCNCWNWWCRFVLNLYDLFFACWCRTRKTTFLIKWRGEAKSGESCKKMATKGKYILLICSAPFHRHHSNPLRIFNVKTGFPTRFDWFNIHFNIIVTNFEFIEFAMPWHQRIPSPWIDRPIAKSWMMRYKDTSYTHIRHGWQRWRTFICNVSIYACRKRK